MPFTINLDPFLRKVIKEEVQNLEQLGFSLASQAEQPQLSLTRRQAVELNRIMSPPSPPEGGFKVERSETEREWLETIIFFFRVSNLPGRAVARTV